MDPMSVTPKFKKEGTMIICYCDQMPEVTGTGTTEASAEAHFWKAFNKWEDNQDHAKTESKKAQLKLVDPKKLDGKKSDGKKKAA